MARHAYFEKLCALALQGELGPLQLHELDKHLAECEACRQTSIDYGRILQQVVPVTNCSDGEYIESRRAEMRDAVMRSVAAIDREYERQQVSTGRAQPLFAFLPAGMQKSRFALPLWGGLGAVSLAVAAFWAGTYFDGAMSLNKTRGAKAIATSARTAEQPISALHASVSSHRPSGSSDDKQLAVALEEEYRRYDEAQQKNADLLGKLSAEDGKLTEAIAKENALREQIDQQANAIAATKADLNAKTAALSHAQFANSTNTATVAALEIQVHDLTEKMSTQSASLDRERDLLSHGREIRDIIGARNLHIIDVYDTSTEGTTRRPFARAFYTEGKSLVYYAYDLPQRKIDESKFSYVAWGQSNGSKASIRKIGILFHDDQTQRRWSLSFSNPQVLKEIDSVFITLERNDENPSQPKGKRMLTAYLGTAPNHP